MSDGLTFERSFEFAYGEPREVAPGVTRIVAANPGPYTFKGTNTYLVGSQRLAVVDPGPDLAAHQTAILKAAAGRPITHIILTHAHRDHFEGLARLKQSTGALSCGYGSGPLRHASADQAHGRDEHSDHAFVPDICLRDGDVLLAGDRQLSVLHTPGHAPDHLCFALSGTDRVLLSGDHVMGWSTSVVAPPDGRMAEYMASLQRMMTRDDRLYLPGHGDVIREPERTVRAYLAHRRWREQAILDAVRAGHDTIRAIVPVVYRGLDPRLGAAAALSVEAHVVHLIEQGRLRSSPPEPSTGRLSAASADASS